MRDRTTAGLSASAPVPDSGERSRVPRRRVLLVSLLALLTLLVISALVVVASLGAMSAARADVDVISSGAPLVVRDPQLGYVSPPGSTTRRHRDGLAYAFHRDGRGARVASPTDSTPVSAELVFVGGSFTQGRGVEHEETFAAIVARELGRSAVNLGTGAYGTVQSLLLLERHADLAPEVVVYAFIEGHLRRNLAVCAPSLLPHCTHVPHVDFDERGAPFIRPPGAGAAADWARNERFYAAVSSAPVSEASLGAGFELLLDRVRRRLARPPAAPAADPLKRRESMRYLVRRIREVAARMGARLVIACIPELRDPDPGAWPPPPELTGALEPGVELVDIARTLRERGGDGEPLALPGDGHPSAAGHREIARGLLEHLRATGRPGRR